MLTSRGSPSTTGTSLIDRRPIYAALLLVLLLATFGAGWWLRSALGAGGASHAATSAPVTGGPLAGQVSFVDAGSGGALGTSDGLTAVARGLPAPAAGSQYMAWLVDAQSGKALALGALAAQGGQYVLRYPGGGAAAGNLLAFTLRPKLEITAEHGAAQQPAGRVVLAGTIPPDAFQHVRHLLVSWDTTPGKIGFLVGLLDQTRLLAQQAFILRSQASSGDGFAIKCVAQTLVDIIQGAHGPNAQPIPSYCDVEDVAVTGDGYGILGNEGYLIGVSDHAALAAAQPDATAAIRAHAGTIEIAAADIKGWVTTINQDVVALVNNPNDTSKAQEIATLADYAYHGVDTDGDGQINPVRGEAGALSAYQQGQLLASVALSTSS